jgi:hypothetical protein
MPIRKTIAGGCNPVRTRTDAFASVTG